jgi:hypothetical protein
MNVRMGDRTGIDILSGSGALCLEAYGQDVAEHRGEVSKPALDVESREIPRAFGENAQLRDAAFGRDADVRSSS